MHGLISFVQDQAQGSDRLAPSTALCNCRVPSGYSPVAASVRKHCGLSQTCEHLLRNDASILVRRGHGKAPLQGAQRVALPSHLLCAFNLGPRPTAPWLSACSTLKVDTGRTVAKFDPSKDDRIVKYVNLLIFYHHIIRHSSLQI